MLMTIVVSKNRNSIPRINLYSEPQETDETTNPVRPPAERETGDNVMSQVDPTVRYLILCEDIQTDPEEPRRITLVGLISALRSLEQPPFPLLYRELCVFLQLTECRGPADGRIEIQHADSGQVVFRTRTRTIPLPNDPLEVVGVAFRLRRCLFREAGLYWVQFWYNEQMIAQQALLLR